MRSRIFKASRSTLASPSIMCSSFIAAQYSSRSRAPSGNARAMSATARPLCSAPRRSAAIDQPSNGTSPSAAAASRGLRSSGVIAHLLGLLPGLLLNLGGRLGGAGILLDEAERAQVGHAAGIQPAVQVVAFVLDHPGVEARDRAIDRLTL